MDGRAVRVGATSIPYSVDCSVSISNCNTNSKLVIYSKIKISFIEEILFKINLTFYNAVINPDPTGNEFI